MEGLTLPCTIARYHRQNGAEDRGNPLAVLRYGGHSPRPACGICGIAWLVGCGLWLSIPELISPSPAIGTSVTGYSLYSIVLLRLPCGPVSYKHNQSLYLCHSDLPQCCAHKPTDYAIPWMVQVGLGLVKLLWKWLVRVHEHDSLLSVCLGQS